MSIVDKWLLDEPLTADGTMLDGWNFTMGTPYLGPKPVTCKPYQEGRETPVAFGGLDTPYLRLDISETIVRIDPSGVQIFPIAVAGASSEYWIVNATRVLDAIHPSSNIEHYTDEEKKKTPELAVRYKTVWNMILDPAKISTDVHIFRLKHYLSGFYISEDIKRAIEKVCPQHGGKFTEVEVA